MPAHAALIERAREKIAELRVDELKAAHVLPDAGSFMPVVIYPHIQYYPPADADALLSRETIRPDFPYALYVHIPFCAFSCHYCHWVKMINPGDAVVDDYLDTLIEEMRLVTARLGVDRVPISTGIFGGGTPTFLSARQLERILTAVDKYFDRSACRQFSFEAEPRSLLGEDGAAKLHVLRDFGIDRISLGVQSFNDVTLKRMGRYHDGPEALQAIEAIRQAGIQSLSIDLIYGYPGQQPEDWIETMNAAIAANVDAWQLYRLRILQHGDRQGAIIHEFLKHGERFPSDDEIRLMKMVSLMSSVEAGYEQRFTRIFARGQEHLTHFMWDYCVNLSHVIGLGPSAWSNYNRLFTVNVSDDFDRYRELVRSGKVPADRALLRDTATDARRSLISPLKNHRVRKSLFERRMGFTVEEHFGPELARLENLGLLGQDAHSVRLTERGRFFADETMMQLFQKRFLPFPEITHDLMPE
jgi:oxygen-independent coproporphyrinogen III oxidase